MADLARLIVRLEAQSSQLLSELDKANKKISGFERSAQQSLKKFSSGVKSSLAGIGIGFTLGGIISETAAAEKALANLDNAVKNNGGAAGLSTKQLAGMSEELQKLTTYSDDAIQNMQALLLRFRGIGGSEFKPAQSAILDLATAMGVDLQTAAKTVGKALESPEKGLTALTKVGVRFTDSQKDVIKGLVDTGRSAEAQQIILGQLEQRFGGAAEAARNTFGGALEGLKNAASDLLENKGGLPGITGAINDLTKALQDDETKAAADSLTTGLFKGLTAVGKAAAAALTPLAKLITAANDAGAKLDKKFFGEQFSEDEFARIFDVAARGTGPTRRGRVGAGTSTATAEPEVIDTKPYDNARKAIEQLIQSQEQQIAVYGKGEAATIKYRIAQGDLADEFKTLGADAGPLADKLTTLTQRYEALQKAAEQKAAVEAIKEMVGALQQEVETYGMGETALLQYRLNHGDLAKQFATAGEAATQYRDDLVSLSLQLELMDEATAGASAAVEEFAKKIEADLAGFGERLQTEFEVVTTELNEFQKQAARNTQDIIADTFETIATSGDISAKSVLKSFGDMIIKLTAQAAAADLAGRLFGEAGGGTKGSSGWLGTAASLVAGFFTGGGTKDSGGRGSPGMAYAIGTKAQPEMFVPDRPGSFYPAGTLGGMKVTNNFYLPNNEPPSKRTQNQLGASAMRGLTTANRRTN